MPASVWFLYPVFPLRRSAEGVCPLHDRQRGDVVRRSGTAGQQIAADPVSTGAEAGGILPEAVQHGLHAALLRCRPGGQQIERLVPQMRLHREGTVDHALHQGCPGVEIDRGRQHDHVVFLQRRIDLPHVIFLHAAPAVAPAGAAAQAVADRLFPQNDLRHRRAAVLCAPGELRRKLGRVAVSAGASHQDQHLTHFRSHLRRWPRPAPATPRSRRYFLCPNSFRRSPDRYRTLGT